jgi:hypothetical protein
MSKSASKTQVTEDATEAAFQLLNPQPGSPSPRLYRTPAMTTAKSDATAPTDRAQMASVCNVILSSVLRR